MTLHLNVFSASAKPAIATAYETASGLHAELSRNGLVAWTTGYVSQRVELSEQAAAHADV
ncbi:MULTISPECIES: hypothetical protein [unclassified Nesterenkonia]|uniref:hypothetical protein n=1 Tax=unclassified Nesterenkonia TaxID=2629769 RepID=UPI001F4C8DD5|nr:MULTISPECIES: hypothetical protein [unclassified Nesterenkonia]MCH8559229.1 hypothetical protein [Nesterenkonia sp. DZ6]MCH8571574.1 hypothetical protein [Nesterenkonia sp. AY15]